MFAKKIAVALAIVLVMPMALLAAGTDTLNPTQGPFQLYYQGTAYYEVFADYAYNEDWATLTGFVGIHIYTSLLLKINCTLSSGGPLGNSGIDVYYNNAFVASPACNGILTSMTLPGVDPALVQIRMYAGGQDAGLQPGIPPESQSDPEPGWGRVVISSAYIQATYNNGPATPTISSVTAGANGMSATVTWGDVANETAYYVERCSGNSCTTGFAVVGNNLAANTTSFADSGLVKNTTYGYRVRAYNADGYSGYSGIVYVTTTDVPPTPSVPSVTAGDNGTTATVTWGDVTNETAYYVERCTGYCTMGFTVVGSGLAANTTSFDDSGLAPATMYGYRVRAYNAAGYSGYSGIGYVTTPATPPTGPMNLTTPYVTNYTYDARNDLVGVEQRGAYSASDSSLWRARTYVYDGLGNPTSITTPEAGTISYSYNALGLLSTRTDARGVVTTYGYDGLNRTTSVAYTTVPAGVAATPDVSYEYGTNAAQYNVGRVRKIRQIAGGAEVGSETYTYDNVGNVTQVDKSVNGAIYTIHYDQYDYVGQAQQMTYPSGRIVTSQSDAIGRVQQVLSDTTTYLRDVQYDVVGHVTGYKYGNGVSARIDYSSDGLGLVQLIQYDNPSKTLFSASYGYVQTPGGPLNGQILKIQDTVEDGRTTTFGYDALLRLKTAVTNGSLAYPQWGLSWDYDAFGNRRKQEVTAGSAFPNSLTFSTNKNQPDSPLDYDAGGNLKNIAGVSLQFDTENRLVQVGNGSVVVGYDANGVRVKKVSGAVTTIYVRSGAQVIAEYVNNNLQKEWIFGRASLVAMIDLTKQTTDPKRKRYYHADHLSTRVVTDANGSTVGEYGHYPFGETWYDTAANGQKFTTYERDSELSGQRIDYALARYYSYQMGRFISPDPLEGQPGDPQSWNRYAYALNDPINQTDPTGLCDEEVQDGVGFPCSAVEPRQWGQGGGNWGPREWASYWSPWNDPFEILKIPVKTTVDIWGYVPKYVYGDPNGGDWVIVDQREIDLLPMLVRSHDPAPTGAPANNDTCGITVKCRGIQTDNLGKIGMQHCDAQVTDSSGQLWSLSGGPQPNYMSITALNAWATSPPTEPFTGTTVYQGNSCTAAGCMIQSTQAWNQDVVKPEYRPVMGPNSNTWLKGTAAGCGVSLPINTWGSIW